ncbi:hypothetical protein AKJ16_DCAP01170 [Drosera capensis]
MVLVMGAILKAGMKVKQFILNEGSLTPILKSIKSIIPLMSCACKAISCLPLILSCISPLTAQYVAHEGVIGESVYALESPDFSMADQSRTSLISDRCECSKLPSGKEFQLPNVPGTRLGAEFVLQKNVLDDVTEPTSYPAAIFDDTLLLETLIGFFVPNPLKKLRRDVGPQFSARCSMLVGQFSPEDSVFNFLGKILLLPL